MAATNDCQICFDRFNGSTRKACACPFCRVSYCRECVAGWLTNLQDEPRCPNDQCKKPWSREYLDSVVTKVWRDGAYREYREKLLFEREKALLPATQPRIEAMNEAKRIERETIAPMRDRRKEIQAQIRQLQMEEAGIQTQVWDLTNHCERLRTGQAEGTSKQAKTFVRRCPAEGCRGFLSTAWKCGVCELFSCPDCHEVKGVARDSDHTCKPENVETAKLLARDTKPCPKCGEMITKIDGCDQMWCVSCHTAFSWRTGQVATGVVHNPHYYEWQRRQGGGAAPRVAGDIPCGGFPDWSDVRRALVGAGGGYPSWVTNLELAHRRMNHVMQIDVPALARPGVHEQDNIDLRIQYLLNQVSEADMMSQLIAREKKKEKEREIRRVYETLGAAGADIFRRMIEAGNAEGVKREEATFKPLITELNELRKFINEALDSLRRRYTCALHGFDMNWDRLNLKKTAAPTTEVYTPYGKFDQALQTYVKQWTEAKAKPIANDEDPSKILATHGKELRLLHRLIRAFPTGNLTVTRAAQNIQQYYEDDYMAHIYSNGTNRMLLHMATSYRGRLQRNAGAPEAWVAAAKTVELVMKEENTIS